MINSLLIGINWNNIFANCTDVNSQYTRFLEILNVIIQNHIPIKVNKNSNIPEHINKMIQLEIYFGKTLINPMFEKNISYYPKIYPIIQRI